MPFEYGFDDIGNRTGSKTKMGGDDFQWQVIPYGFVHLSPSEGI